LPGEIIAAFLWAQMEEADEINRRRKAIYDVYHDALYPLEQSGHIRRPIIPSSCGHNAHMYYILLRSQEERATLIEDLKEQGVISVFHYVPLHNSLAGRTYGRISGELTNTEGISDRLLRLPLWIGITSEQQTKVIDALGSALAG
jgi:dTDP-4-amino-4,6-dideoxygalactose transaminase